MELSQLAVPFVYGLILFLGLPSQWLLMHLEPGPLTKNEITCLNVALLLILVTYTQSVFVDPGKIPKDWVDKQELENSKGKIAAKKEAIAKNRKWCRRCDAAKPPRAHHCKACKRCVPKMDHHCPWTANCVSYTTFPHFLRFLTYASGGLSLLEFMLFPRLLFLWNNRDLPFYLGPSAFQIGHLFIVFITNSITLFTLSILCIRNIWCLAVNTTTIEGWEIERHRTLVRRARVFGGYLEGLDGNQIRIKQQEFPYDIGIWSNIVQGMGTANPLSWINPLAATPPVQTGLSFPTNGFEDAGTTWPPPDPDRSYRRQPRAVNTNAFVYQDSSLSPQDTIAAFKARQAEDEIRKRRPFVERAEAHLAQQRVEQWNVGDQEGYEYGDEASDVDDETEPNDAARNDGEGEEGWRNSEGERLQDFGVDEDVEFYDEQEDEIPLSELIARRKTALSSSADRSS